MITKQIINESVRRLKQSNPKTIILFGSAASNPQRARDLDILVVKQTKKNRIDRVLDLKYKFFGDTSWSTPIDMVVYTPQEFAKAKRDHRIFIEEIIQKGKILYEKH